MLHIHHSNRVELLRATLLRQLDAAVPHDPFVAEQLIVPSAALRRHLSLALAEARGICANVQFGFLASWLWRQIARQVPGVGDESPFAATTLVWRVHAAFGDAGFVAGHARLQAYLHDADALMRYELAAQAAALFEQYLIYRPDWLQAWGEGRDAVAADDGKDAAWQAALWRRLVAELGLRSRHPAHDFVAALPRGAAGLPARVHVFALPDIAPLHLQLLHQIGRHIELHLYVLNPCREYWFDLIDRRRLSHLAARGRTGGHEEEGNRLLAAWGRQAQQHIESLLEVCGDDADDDACFEPAPGHSLLAQLQNTLLELRAVAPGSLTMADGDRSLELHVCHSLTRELEVLHDHLLGLFAADPTLRPGDVLVVVPDLEAAAPLIDAVFGAAPKDRALPYALCAARRSSASGPARCLLALLTLAASRCTAGDVFALLQQPLVARRFGLDDDALASLHGWLLDAGFHWALDDAQRAQFDVPATPRHTLDDALQRLFLGYALPQHGAEPFDGRLGAGDAEGSRAAALGALWRYARALRRAARTLQRPHLPAEWTALLSALLAEFFAPADDELDAVHELRQALHDLADAMQRGGATQPLPLAVVRAALQQQLDAAGGGGAAGGSINFAALGALRGLPFAVVCALGLNDGAFPAVRRPLEFDLMAQQPRRGDRQRRSDDRGLMLELLLAARHSLYLSHTGRSVRDNTPLPPSVLVAELLELLLPAIAADAGDAAALQQARRRLVIEHPLQPFALAAFDVDADPRLRSHDRELAAALRASLAAPPQPGSGAAPDAELDTEDDEATVADASSLFFAAPLPPAGPPWRRVDLAQLIAFFRNPCRVLLRRRLGVELASEADVLQDDEPFVADRRVCQALSRRLLPLLLGGADPARLPALARAGSDWPDGQLGAAQLQLELQALQDFATRLRAALAEPCVGPHTLTLDLALQGEAWRLQADMADLRASGLLRWRDGEPRATDYLQAWLQQLALCAAAPPGVALRTRWLWPGGEFHFERCADATEQLHALLALYRHGLCEPLRFFPRAAWMRLDKGLDAARREWRPSLYAPYAEGADAAYTLALRGVDEPLDAEFERLAAAVFAPLRAHLQGATA